ncbi:MAG: hypothetical protein FJ213_03610 [Ignavibacteria bacterium]|nr:hypothetical protein [Ignavibacteria bacterium]
MFSLILTVGKVSAREIYYFKGRNYGSESVFNPISLFLNAGFDMIQVDRNRKIFNLPLNRGAKNVLRNLANPFTPIRNYGTWNFIRDQILPISFERNNAQYWPNYTLHLIGGGMTYVNMTEWYSYYKFPSPEIFSLLTYAMYHFINEAVENDTHQGDNVDPIADIYIFDIGAVILFSFDNVKKFFAEDLNLADWSLQPSFILMDEPELHNNGQFFSIKWKFPFSDHLHLFYYFGTNGVGGLSYKFDSGEAISLGVGMAASEFITLNAISNKKTLDLVWNLGLFYDLNNSLLANISWTKKTDYMINVNIYPGLIKIGDISPGLWLAINKNGSSIWGLNFSWLPFGFALK